MLESYFSLSRKEQSELLDTAAAHSGRPAHILEKDVWVVWALSVLFASPLADLLTFKGGTSLSKAYGAINRFSEDIDLTYDIRSLLADMVTDDEGIPPTPSQASKWTKAVRERLPQWLSDVVVPVLYGGLPEGVGEDAIQVVEPDSVVVSYAALREGTGYISPKIRLEFGARSTGEPFEILPVSCDLASVIQKIQFPKAEPRVLKMERTFWEKATAIHVFCKQEKMRGDRFSRHWYDLVQLSKLPRMQHALSEREWLSQVVRHKSMFFVEKNASGDRIDYNDCQNGLLKLIPSGAALETLRNDYANMIQDGILLDSEINFDFVLKQCLELEGNINKAVRAE